nr:EOG090X05V9 [Triops cancriformis]
MRDVPKFLAVKQASSNKDIAAQWSKLETLYNKKLWHQLTVEVLEFVCTPAFSTGSELVELYENFLADFENKINPLSLIEICSYIVRQFPSPAEKLKFLDHFVEKVKGNPQAIALCKVLAGGIKLHELSDQPGTKNLIEEIEKILDEVDGITPVHGRYYLLASDLYRIQSKHADYYRSALRYLGCTDLETLNLEEQRQHAFYLGLAALLGEGVYNLGELLAHPILESLKGTDQAWLVDLLFALNAGDIAGFQALRPKWSTQADLLAKEKLIHQKITLLALMEMTFKRPATDRQLSFVEIAATTGLPVNEVELLIMKSLSQGLLKGTIDQVAGTAHFTWVQPRVLDKNQLASMMTRLEAWTKDISSIEHLVETKAHDILTL